MVQRVHPCKTFKGTGKPHELEAAMPSRPGPRGPRRVRLSGACGRGGANSYPSQYPTPAGLSRSD